MSETLSKTLHGDFDSVFHEVTQLGRWRGRLKDSCAYFI